MKQRLKFPQSIFHTQLFFPLLALTISILLFSCLSRSSKETLPDAEASQTQKEESPALSDTSEESEGADSSDSESSAPPEIAVDADDVDSEAASEDFAAPGLVPEVSDSKAASSDATIADVNGADSSDSEPSAPPEIAVDVDDVDFEAASEDFAAPGLVPEVSDSEAASSDAAIADVNGADLPDSESSAPPEIAVDADNVDSEAATEDFAATDIIPEVSDSKAASPEIDNSDLEAVVSEGGIPSAVATAPNTASNQQPEAIESNPLSLTEEPAADSTRTDEARSATSSPPSSEIVPSIAGIDPEQFDQADETDAAISAAAPARFLEAPGELTITLGSIGWILRSDRSTPGSWRFLGREMIGDSTSFRFLFSEVGKWNLVFERQDLSSGKSEEVVRRVAVNETDGSPSIENGPIPLVSPNPISGTPPADADARYLAALGAAEEGRIDEAIKYYEQDASRDDSAGARARDALVGTAAKFGTVGPLLTWLPRYLEDNPSPEVLRAALEAFSNEAGYDSQTRAILEKLAESENSHPEWLYRLAFLLEKPGEERDLDRAASLYQEVINCCPLSKWRDRSEERLLWLQRHYFRIR